MRFVAHFNTKAIVGEELAGKLKAAAEQLKAARLLIQEALYKSPEGSLINKSGSVTAMDFNADFSTINVTYDVTRFEDVQIMITEGTPLKTKQFIPESVLNTLLHGKLLTDDEKRALLVGQGFIKEAAK